MADIYTVTSQRQTTQLNPAGTGFEEVWEVTYRAQGGAADGTVGKVIIPETRYTAEEVDARIRSVLEHVNNVAGL